MDDYRQVKLKDITDIINGGTPSTSISEYWNGEIPWITPKDLSGYDRVYIAKGERNITQKGLENSSAQLLPKNTILFSSRAPIGYVAIAKEKVTTNQGFKNLICNPDIVYYKYLYYWLKKNGKHIEKAAIGSTFAEVSKGDMENIELTLPPLSEQKRIANILSSFDNKIEILKKENKILEDIAENIFKEWFVKYNFPNKDGKPYRDSNGKMIDSELGPIPEGWRVGSIYEICNILYGYPFNSKLFSEETGFPLIRIRNLADSSINTFTTEDYDEKYIIQSGDILVGMDGDFLITRWNSENALLNQRICKLEPQSNVSKSYILYITKPYIGLLQKTNFGTTVAHLGKSDWDRFRVLIPNTDIFLKYNKLSNTLEKKIINNHQNMHNLTRQKDILIRKLIK